MQTKIRSQRGGALILAVIAFILIAGAGTALFSLTLRGHTTTLGASNGDLAYHIAEAGIDDALNKLAAYALKPNDTNADFAVIGKVETIVDGEVKKNVNVVSGGVNRGSFYVTVDPPYAGYGTYLIRSVGTYNTERRGIETTVVAEDVPGSFQYGLFGDVTVDASGSLVTDGYRSSNGSYEDQLAKSPNSFKKTPYVNATGHIGSNGGVYVGGSALIFGNATPGPGNAVTGGGYINGSTAPASSPFPLSDIIYTPQGDNAVALPSSLGVDGQTTYMKLDTLTLANKEDITVYGNVTLYVSGSIKITAQTKLNLAEGAKLTIYQESGTLEVHGGADLNGGVGVKSGIPSDFQIWSNTSTVTVNGGSGYMGAIYAPKADIKLNGNADYYGGMVGKSIKPIGNAMFHYDEDLGAVSIPKIVFKVKSSNQYVPGK